MTSQRMPAPVLSLILCSRNDAYMGNSRWRLATTLNFIGGEVAALGAEYADAVEIVVTDWASDTPLAEVLSLDPAAARLVSFLTISPDVARPLQRDSPFPEVLALNAAARRARGQYIGRIDQDTLVGRRFLEHFLGWTKTGSPIPEAPLATSLWFSCRRAIPYRFASRCPSEARVAGLVRTFGRRLMVDQVGTFHYNGVGIWLIHRDVWASCAGYDERMIYMNDMEIDMAARLMTRHRMVDLGTLVDHDFYHLDHYPPTMPRASSAHRRVNGERRRDGRGFRPSGERWGLPDHVFERSTASHPRATPAARTASMLTDPAFAAFVLWTMAQTLADRAWYGPFRQRWLRRVGLVYRAILGQPVTEWPERVRRLWAERPSAKGGA